MSAGPDLEPLRAVVSSLVAKFDAMEQDWCATMPRAFRLDGGKILVSQIVRLVAFETGLSPNAIMGPRRTAVLFRARAAVCWLARALTSQSYPGIGLVLGGRHHTSVMAALSRAEELRERDPAFRMLTDKLHRRLSTSKEN